MIRALTQAFGHNFQFAVQLRSFVHFCANVTGKLKERGFHTSVSKEFLADICGIAGENRPTGAKFPMEIIDL